MKLTVAAAHARFAANLHGVLCTTHPDRGADPQPVVYTVSDDGYVGIPIDSVKPKTSTRLKREQNLAADPRATLLVEHWEIEDWSRLWWVKAQLSYLPGPERTVVDDLAERLSRTVPQYADRPFHRILVFGVVGVTGWSGADG
ncbi:hypothetical protein HH308_26075 [Gordonia sp. TBRC 11910]|uniref:PPOX class F420-dependent enzyme n=1 Tax=Gordonia asplenii TaxID=2725283 RepID=A0A848L1E1_9ACTN|nr:pyridoxamine 5'-phosphate oxidase family protein [Gordonia asplenii]NMO04694.1 hypothetical protein [Gordonia asplenii]